MGPEGGFVWVWDALDGGADQPRVQSLLQVHLGHALHAGPLGQLSLLLRDRGVSLLDEGFVARFHLGILGVNG